MWISYDAIVPVLVSLWLLGRALKGGALPRAAGWLQAKLLRWQRQRVASYSFYPLLEAPYQEQQQQWKQAVDPVRLQQWRKWRQQDSPAWTSIPVLSNPTSLTPGYAADKAEASSPDNFFTGATEEIEEHEHSPAGSEGGSPLRQTWQEISRMGTRGIALSSLWGLPVTKLDFQTGEEASEEGDETSAAAAIHNDAATEVEGLQEDKVPEEEILGEGDIIPQQLGARATAENKAPRRRINRSMGSHQSHLKPNAGTRATPLDYFYLRPNRMVLKSPLCKELRRGVEGEVHQAGGWAEQEAGQQPVIRMALFPRLLAAVLGRQPKGGYVDGPRTGLHGGCKEAGLGIADGDVQFHWLRNRVVWMYPNGLPQELERA